MQLHRIGRRAFLRDLGKGTAVVAVLGTTAVACGDDDSDLAGGETGATTSTTATPSAAGEGFRWQRVELGFVSAYVLARGQEAAVVDTGVEGSDGELLAGLEALGLGWDAVGHVVLTHRHPDHQGSLSAVVDAARGAVAYAGAADVEAITGADVEPLDDGDEVFGLQVVATPGHTPGHISVYDPAARFLVAGDALNEDAGEVLGPNPEFSNDHELALAQVPKLAALEVDTVVFGHGAPVLTDADEAIQRLAAE